MKIFEKLKISENYNRGFEDGRIQGWADKSTTGFWNIKNYIPYCSICGKASFYRTNYCPNCGSRLYSTIDIEGENN